jgi:hypothetical protein
MNVQILILFISFFILFFIYLNLIFVNKNKYIEKFYINNKYEIPKKIFCYWDNEDENNIVNFILKKTKKKFYNSGWKFIILNKNNVYNYVNKSFVDKYKNCKPYLFSDFLRLYLLYFYGGVWLDASIIIFKTNFLNKYYNEMMKNKYDITLYELKIYSDKYPYLENWFIMAPKKNKFIKDLYYEFDYAYRIGFLNYKRTILANSGIQLDKTLKSRDSPNVYLMQHAIIHYLMNKGNYYYINKKDAEESMFKAHTKNKWNKKKLIKYIIHNNNWSKYYAIKLTNPDRKEINNENKLKFIKKILNI